MDMDTVRELVAIARENDLSELTVRDKDLRVTVRLQDDFFDGKQRFKSKAKQKRTGAHTAPTVSEAIEPLSEVKPASDPLREAEPASEWATETEPALDPLPTDSAPIPVPAIGIGDFQDSLPEVFKSEDNDKTPAFSGKHAATARIPLAWVPITSPIVGTYREAAQEGEEPYVKAGDTVEQGQVLCAIEALGQSTEIVAEEAGMIREACLEDGTAVEFGTTLFYLQPSNTDR